MFKKFFVSLLIGLLVWSPAAFAASGFTSSQTITRSANTTVYPANGVVGGAKTFTSVAPSAQDELVSSAELEVDDTALISGETSYRIYLYSVTPPSALADNAAWDLPSGDRASFLGYVDLCLPVDLGSTLYCRVDNINKHFSLAGTSVFGYLVTIGGYTPTSARVYKVTLHFVAL